MGLFKRTKTQPVSREQAEQVLERADVQSQLRAVGIDPARLEQQVEHGELSTSGGKTTIRVTTTIRVPQDPQAAQTQPQLAPPSDADDPFETGKL
jgi:hypothetical protein